MRASVFASAARTVGHLLLAGTLVSCACWMLLSNAGFLAVRSAGGSARVHALIAVTLLLAGLAFGGCALRLAWRSAGSYKFVVVLLGGVAAPFVAWWLWKTVTAPPIVPGATREASRYLNDAMYYLERYYVDRSRVSWDAVHAAALKDAAGARSPKDTYAAIRAALALAGDRHGMLLSRDWRNEPADLQARRPAPEEIPELIRLRKPQCRLLSGGVGYLAVPSYVGDRRHASPYIAAAHMGLREVDAHGPCGWILDLRGNLGGNVWPTLDATAPLLWEGRVGGVEMPQFGRRIEWWIDDGRSFDLTVVYAWLGPISGSPLLASRAAPMAVLTSSRTASSGEALAVVLHGRRDTRFFGAPTAGVPTALQTISLADGAELLITVGHDTDRLGRSYSSALIPDEETGDDLDVTEASRTIARALAWVRQQAACRGVARSED